MSIQIKHLDEFNYEKLNEKVPTNEILFTQDIIGIGEELVDKYLSDQSNKEIYVLEYENRDIDKRFFMLSSLEIVCTPKKKGFFRRKDTLHIHTEIPSIVPTDQKEVEDEDAIESMIKTVKEFLVEGKTPWYHDRNEAIRQMNVVNSTFRELSKRIPNQRSNQVHVRTLREMIHSVLPTYNVI